MTTLTRFEDENERQQEDIQVTMMPNRFLRLIATKRSQIISTTHARCFSFSFAGPKELNDILKKELVQDKPRSEVADIWYSYHEEKDNVHGLVLNGEDASNVLSRAANRCVQSICC